MEAIVVGVVGLLVLFVCIPNLRRAEADRRSFEERFPPISEREFLALCRPGTRTDVALMVRRTLAECLAVEYDRIHPSSRLGADLGAE